MLNGVAAYKFCSKIDIRCAYHRVAIRTEEHQFTAFEANGHLWQISRIPVVVTNAVLVFQRIMDKFSERKGLKGAELYIDDIGGEPKEVHKLNLNCSLDVEAQENFTPNMDKCVFGTRI